MNIYTAHLRPGREPVLVAEGFSLAASLFGPLWLFARGGWIAGSLALAASLLFAALGLRLGWPEALLWAGFAWLHGLFARDLLRWDLARRGYDLAHVLAARGAEAAYARLLAARPDLLAEARA